MLLPKVDKLSIIIGYLDLKMTVEGEGWLFCLEIGYKGLSIIDNMILTIKNTKVQPFAFKILKNFETRTNCR